MAENINIKLILDTANSAKTLKETRAALEQIKAAEKQIGKGTEGFNQLNAAAESLNATLEMVALSFDDVYQETKPLTTQLGELEDRMYALAAAGESNTEEFKLLQEEAIRLRKVIIDVDTTVDAFAQKGAKLKGFIGITQGIAGGFAVAQGAAALFGGESKNLEKSLVKLNSIMTVLNGIQSIYQIVSEKNVILDGISNGIKSLTIKLVSAEVREKAALAAANGTATISQRALNAAMAANPIGILITLIVAGVAALSLWSNESEDATKNQEELNAQLERTKQLNNELAKSYLDLKGVQQDAAIIELENQLANETNLKKQLDLIDQITVAKKDQLDIDLETAILEGEYKENADAVQKIIKQNIELNKQLNIEEQKAIENAKKPTTAAEAAMGTAEREKRIKDLISDSKRGIDINAYYANLDLLDYQKIQDKKTKANKDFTDKTKINYSDVDKFLTKLDTEKLVLSKNISNEQRKLDLDAANRKKQLIDDANKKAKQDAIDAKRIADDAEKERRRKLIDELNDRLSRTKDATSKLIDLKASEIDDIKEKELKLQEITYGKQKQDVIEKARAREIKIVEDKFANLKMMGKTNVEDEKAFLAEKERLAIDSNIKLLDSENLLLKGYDENNTKINKTIETRFDDISNLTQSETAKINQERLALELSYEKQAKLLAAESIQDVKARDEAILLINQEYATKQIKQLNNTKDAELEILDEKYYQDINKLGITSDEKDKINAQYALDKIKIEKATQAEIDKISADDIKAYQEYQQKKREIFMQSMQAIASETLTLFATIQATISAGNLSVIENAKNDALAAFDAEREAYDNLQGDKTLAQKAAWIEEQKIKAERAALEEEYNKQSREEQNKANLRQWEYQVGQAAVTAAGFILKAGEQSGVPGAAAAAVLSLIQVAQILANPPQKLATGGPVRGAGTETSDSIPTMLSNGEYVIKADSVKKMGIPMLNAINATGKAPMINSGINQMTTGGLVTNINVDNSQLAAMMVEFMNRPIKTYVTSSDVTQTQKNDNRLNSRTTF
jgi:hypothetical protein